MAPLAAREGVESVNATSSRPRGEWEPSRSTQRIARDPAEEVERLQTELDLATLREGEIREMLRDAHNAVVQHEAELQALRQQIAFMESTRAWRLGARYVHLRNRLRGRLQASAETGLDLTVVAAMLSPLLILPWLGRRLVRLAHR
jgi:hypothetical protein